MKLIPLLALLSLPLHAQESARPVYTQNLIITRSGLVWLELGDSPLYAFSIAFSDISAAQLYPGKKLHLEIKDSTGMNIPAQFSYDFDAGRASVFCKLSRIPEGAWLHVTGSIEAATEYQEESFSLKIGTAQEEHTGEGYRYSCSAPEKNEFVLHERGFTFPTMMTFLDEEGREINPLYNRVLKSDAQLRDLAFVFADDIDVRQLSFKIERREARSPQEVPVNLRLNVAGLGVESSSATHSTPSIEIAPIPKSLGILHFYNMNIAHRAGVSRGRYEATNIGLVLAHPSDTRVEITPKQKIIFRDGKGKQLPATLKFVTPMKGEPSNKRLTFNIDGVPQALPMQLSGEVKATVNGEQTTLPISFKLSGFPKK